MKIGFLEPHLKRFGGIRRILEFSNRMVARGHEVTIYVPEGERRECSWMRCDARVRHITDGFTDDLDVLVFNHEPQWYLIDLFEGARRRVFYALHDGASYGKEGSWEAARSPVERILANSAWTAERIEAQTGRTATVVLGGINPGHFHPRNVSKRYPVLAVGDRRSWKGTDTIERACELLGVPLETYAPKNLSQDRMAAEYGAAEVFAVGSEVEGFGQPGLEALACGTPLVTTDNGGSREYAIDEQTALVVPPGDSVSMAQAIRRLQTDDVLASRLRDNGLQLVADKFDWEQSTDRLIDVFQEVVTAPANRSAREASPEAPTLSLIVLAWDQLTLTQRCVETLRRHTDVAYELIIVDNGSAWDARHYAEVAADVPALNERNLGFAAGMNSGLRQARGRFVAFCNNDTEFPPRWASQLLEAHASCPSAGITAPAVTQAHNRRTVRVEPGDYVEVLDPFEEVPAAVVWLMETVTARSLGGFDEVYAVASGEDIDLAFTVWVNDLDIVFDQRVLVDHVGKGTAATKLPDWRRRWALNAEIFLGRWTDPHHEPPRLRSCPPGRFERNIAASRSVAMWMQRYYRIRERSFPGKRVARKAAGKLGHYMPVERVLERFAKPTYQRLSRRLPERVRRFVEGQRVPRAGGGNLR